MTRAWATTISGIQDALAAQILVEREAQRASLPTPLHGPDFDVIGAANRGSELLLPTGMRVFPPAGTLDGETSGAFEATLVFPVLVTVRSISDADVLELLREAVGLLIDAVQRDILLGGKTGGMASPFLSLGPIDVDGGQAVQEIQVRYVVRN